MKKIFLLTYAFFCISPIISYASTPEILHKIAHKQRKKVKQKIKQERAAQENRNNNPQHTQLRDPFYEIQIPGLSQKIQPIKHSFS